ncbi:MAG TPA: hemolysin III family protein [Nocardioidaceae bacterium]|nr:hemolysin III family protein [Nocardioidaceae bacterium]
MSSRERHYPHESGKESPHESARATGHRVEEAGEHLREQVREVIDEVKPKLRGWLHAATAPLTLIAGVVLIVLSPDAATRLGSTIFAASALLLFTVSAVYHRGTWSPRVWAFLRRFDHANIFLLIAGSYTPFTLLLLEGRDRTVLLTVVWVGAGLGVLFRIFWAGAPRWLYTPIYIGLGWAAVFYAPEFVASTDNTVLTLMVVGGLLYTLGALVYGLQRPDPWPTWFGFHEIFHTLTILAFVTHYVGVSIATYSLR